MHEHDKRESDIAENDKPKLRKCGKVIRENHENDLWISGKGELGEMTCDIVTIWKNEEWYDENMRN